MRGHEAESAGNIPVVLGYYKSGIQRVMDHVKDFPDGDPRMSIYQRLVEESLSRTAEGVQRLSSMDRGME